MALTKTARKKSKTAAKNTQQRRSTPSKSKGIPVKGGKAARPGKHKRTAVSTIPVWEQDPGDGNSPNGGELTMASIPKPGTGPLATYISNPKNQPEAKTYPKGTDGFRYWNLCAALARGSQYWSVLLPNVSWEVGSKLPVNMDAGNDFNANYDRTGLNFYHGTAGNITVYSGESPDVINHEQGHAVLDSFKPQLWDAASIEVAAFHESFGDMSAILCALQVSSLRSSLLTETGGILYSSSKLSRLAEQLGWAIRQIRPDLVDRDCLRNAVNEFTYSDPDSLPTRGPASTLTSEPHSFSRVFTGAFFEGLAGMFKLQKKQDEASLLQVSQDMGKILTEGIRIASVVPSFFSQVAVSMIHYAQAQFANSGYDNALKSAFVRHGIISPASALSALASRGMEFMNATAKETATSSNGELPKLRMQIAEYGLGIDNIIVHSASEPRRLDVAGAAFAMGSLTAQSADEAAKSFFEDLIKRGRIKIIGAESGSKGMFPISRVNEPQTHETHTHELRKEGRDFVLRRVRVDCCLLC